MTVVAELITTVRDLNDSLAFLEDRLDQCGCDVDPCAGEGLTVGENYDLNLRVATVFILFIVSLAGPLIPILGKKVVSPFVLVCGKHLGTGIILATALVHMLSPSVASLTSECQAWASDYEAYAYAIALISVALMHAFDAAVAGVIERRSGHRDEEEEEEEDDADAHERNRRHHHHQHHYHSHHHHHHHHGHTHEVEPIPVVKKKQQPSNSPMRPALKQQNQAISSSSTASTFPVITTKSNGGEGIGVVVSDTSTTTTRGGDYLEDGMEEIDIETGLRGGDRNVMTTTTDVPQILPEKSSSTTTEDPACATTTTVARCESRSEEEEATGTVSREATAVQTMMLEFAFTFHSVIIGITAAVVTENFTQLLVALVFHQFFEGIGLGSRLASETLINARLRIVFAVVFALSAPVGVMIGIAIIKSSHPDAAKFMLMQGVLDAICSGILLYVGFVLLLIDFPNDLRRYCRGKRRFLRTLLVFALMWLGAGFMAFLGKYL